MALPKKFCIASILVNVKRLFPLETFPSTSFLPKKDKEKDKEEIQWSRMCEQEIQDKRLTFQWFRK